MTKRTMVFLLLMLLCSLSQAAQFTGMKQSLTGDQLLLTPSFDLQISQKVIEAIDNGIVITFVIQLQLINQVDWWFDETIGNKTQTFEVRYFSLSGQYQLHNIHSKKKQSFVNLEQLLETLSTQTQFSFTDFTTADQFTTRIFLDKQALPSTMQLPTVFDSDWNIMSDWHTELMALPTAEPPQP